jgi:hypothetical protein
LACVVGLRLTAEQLLPALSIVLILGGLALAAVLRVAGSRKGSRSATWRDIAALIVFLGFAGAMLSDHGDALSLLGIDATPVASASAN